VCMSCVRRCTLCGEEYWKCPLGSSLAAMMEAVSARIAVWLAAEHEGVAKRQVGGDDPSRFCRSLAVSLPSCRRRGPFRGGRSKEIRKPLLIGCEGEIWTEAGRSAACKPCMARFRNNPA
jgi:hypothetical protein